MSNQKSSAVFDYRIYTDGGCLVNPNGPGGIGVVVINLRTNEIREYSEAYQQTTNNRMEIRAAICGLSNVPAGSNVELYSDSQYVVMTAIGRFRESKNQDLWEKLHAAEKGKNVAYQWVRGHNGDKYNERCDELATLAMQRLQRKVDDGFAEAKAAAQQNTYAARETRRKEIPAAYRNDPEEMSPKAYADKYGVSLSCATAIQNFAYKKDRSFKAYTALRTGGIDSWSRKKKEDLVEKTSEEEWNLVSSFFTDEKQVLTCMRWRCRGLGLHDAIRKVEVDQEVAQNASRS